jgi:hypothetical protein
LNVQQECETLLKCPLQTPASDGIENNILMDFSPAGKNLSIFWGEAGEDALRTA